MSALLLRVFLPVAVLVVLLDELLTSLLRATPSLDPGLQGTLHALGTAVMICGGVAYAAGRLGRKLDQAEAGVQVANAQLERRIQERTAELVSTNASLEAEIQRRRSAEENYQRFFDNAAEGAYRSTPEGRVIQANQSLARMFGYDSPAEFKARVIDLAAQEYVDPAIRAGFVQQVREHGSVVGFETRLRRKDGSVGWFSLSARAVRSEDGRLDFLEGMIQDVTERKAAEAEIRRLNQTLEQQVRERTAQLEGTNQTLLESRNQLRLALEAANAGTWSWVVDTGLVHLGERCRALYGFETEEAASFDTWLGSVLPEDRERLLDQFKVLVEPDAPDAWLHEFRIFHPSKGVRWIGAHGRVERDVQGRAQRFFGLNLDITERKQDEQILREQLTQIEAIYENAPVGLCLLSTDFEYVRIKRRLAEMNGRSVEAHLGRSVREAVPHLADRTEALCRRVIETGQPVLDIEMTGETPAQPGAGRSWMTYWSPVSDTQGRVCGVNVVVEETTERRRAEHAIRQLNETLEQRVRERTAQLESTNQALSRSESLLRAVTDHSPDPIFLKDREGRVLFANPAAAASLGKLPEDLVGKTDEEILTDSATSRAIMESDRRVMESNAVEVVEGKLLTPQGPRVHLATKAPYRDLEGRVLGIVVVARDITERQREQVALQASEARFHALFESAPVAIALHGANGRFLQVNPAYANMLGYSCEELVRLGSRRVTHPDDVPEGQRLYRELCEGQRDRYMREKRFVRRDGHVVWARSVNSALRDASGQLIYIVSVVVDITAEKRVGEQTAAFARLGRELGAAETPRAVASLVLAAASDLFGWDASYVHLAGADWEEVEPVLTMDTIEGTRVEVPAASLQSYPTPLMLEVMRRGAIIINRDGGETTAPSSVCLRSFGDTSPRSASILCVPIHHGSKVVGVCSIQSYTPLAYRRKDLELLQVLADHCGGALERVHAAVTMKRLEAEILEISTREQRRIGFELHDGLGQVLTGIALKAKVLEQTLLERQLTAAGDAAALVKLLSQAMNDTRRLARGLAPTELDLSGLAGALDRLGLDLTANTGIPCRVTCRPADLHLQTSAALHLYRLAQEAVHNALQHGQPHQLEVALSVEGRQLCLVVRDDGKGFDPKGRSRPGMGLSIMRYRASAVGGELTISSQINHGTEIRCVLSDVNRWMAAGKDP